MRVVGAAVLLVFSLGRCSHTGFGFVPYVCVHPSPAFIANQRMAVLAARTAWHCMKPGIDSSSEAEWLAQNGALLKDGVWHIAYILPEGYAGGGLNFDIAQSNGAVLQAYMTQ